MIAQSRMRLRQVTRSAATSRLLPPFLADRYVLHDYRLVNTRYLYVGLVPPAGGQPTYVPVEDTPHYAFARQVLSGAVALPLGGYDSYQQYAAKNHGACSAATFEGLIDSIKMNGYDAAEHPILVFRSWHRPWPPTRWDVADGFHRLAVLVALGKRTVRVGRLKPRQSLWQRFMARWKKS